MEPINFEEMGRYLYDCYGQSVENKNYQGLPMLTWGDLPFKIQSAWISVAKGALTYLSPVEVGE